MSEPFQPAPTISAATVVLLRDGASGLEVLMLHRNSSRGAFAGYWVFPGGKVDADDADEVAAAVREAVEETGIVVDPSLLVRFSHWTPPVTEPRRFATWFFLAPANGAEVKVDDGEIVAFDWLPPGEVLARRDRGEVNLAPPTFITLITLAAYASVAEAIDATRAADHAVFFTTARRTDAGMVVVWHPDVAVDPDVALDAPGSRHRIVIAPDTPWVYERS